MNGIREQVLRDFGDEGADTLRRYFTQVEYTAYWCIRMLRPSEGIDAIFPEVVDDLVLLRNGIYELHQLKTRNESVGPWTIAEVLPILCQQYQGRKAFVGECRYHFVSDQVADNKTSGKNSYGRLYELKQLLEVEQDGLPLRVTEQQQLEEFEKLLLPKICERLRAEYADEIDEATAKMLLHVTWIKTNCETIRNITNQNLIELSDALSEISPATPLLNSMQLN